MRSLIRNFGIPDWRAFYDKVFIHFAKRSHRAALEANCPCHDDDVLIWKRAEAFIL